MQCLSVEIIHYVEGTEPAAVAQRIAHKIHRPRIVCGQGDHKGVFNPLWQSPFCFPPDIQPDKLVYPVDTLMVPCMALPAQPFKGFPETFPGKTLRFAAQGGFHRAVITDADMVVTRFAQPQHAARPVDAFTRTHNFLSDLFLLAGLQSFFAITSLATSRSRASSVYIRFNLRFSSSSCFIRFSSLPSIPPYRCRHL